MRHLLPLLGVSLSLLVGCDDGDPPELDAGPPLDAGFDAGMDGDGGGDAGASDAGTDAGPSDAGPPTPSDVGTAVMSDLGDVSAAVAAVPMATRVDGPFLDIALGTSGLDALIGEDGLMTLALDEPMVRALTDLRQANLLLEILNRARDGLAEMTEPTIVAVFDELTTLIATLESYRDAVARLYRERVDAGFIGTPVVEDPAYGNSATWMTGRQNDLSFVIEGRSAVDETASIEIFCSGVESATATVYDEETGAELATSTDPMGLWGFTVPAPFDTPVPISVEITTPGTAGFWYECGVSATSRRSLRAAPVGYDTSIGSAYDTAFTAWLNAVTNAEVAYGEAVSLGFLSPGVLEATLDAIVMTTDLVAPFAASDALPVPLETYQQVNRQALYVAPMIDAAIASPELTGTDGEGLRTALTDLKNGMQGVLTAVTP